MYLKCSCCGSDSRTMIVRDVNLGLLIKARMGQDGEEIEIRKARICKVCGNVMPYVEPQFFHSLK